MLGERLDNFVGWAQEHLAELDVAETINKDVKDGMERQQREFLLRQQLAAIHKELAELDGKPSSEEDDYRATPQASGPQPGSRRWLAQRGGARAGGATWGGQDLAR